MRLPKALREELTPAGRDAWKRAAEHLGERAEQYVDAVERYAFAVDMVARLRAEWAAAGRPIISQGGATGRATVEHPLIGAIARAERDAASFGSKLGLEPQTKRAPGRPAGASSAPDRTRGAARPGLTLAKGDGA